MSKLFRLFTLSFLILSASLSLAATRPSTEYELQTDLKIQTPDGATISGMMVRAKGVNHALPVILQFTIYARPHDRDLESLKDAADHGYVGVIFYSRGKYLSEDEIWPYEFDGRDAHTAIEWISKQAWCNGSIGMYGGSYNGFTQWAASKYMHPALKTIVPMVAGKPGMGLPMENNIFVNPNYQWTFYVGNNRLLDNAINNDRQRFRQLMFNWWHSGRPYREIDQIDGTPNKWLQKWLMHPSFDAYWRAMTPNDQEFSGIKIPVLTIDGYYNDSQVSSINYVRDHFKYFPQAEHYLVIGPYGHFGAQRGGEPVLNDLRIHDAALFDIKALTFAWFDHILKGQARPEFLKDRVNYFPIGESQWRHAQSLDAMHDGNLRFYLSTNRDKDAYKLTDTKPTSSRALIQNVKLKDRAHTYNDYYPAPIVRDEIDRSSGYVFRSEPLKQDLLINGSFSGELLASINFRDFDFGLTLYELTPDGKYFHLSYTIQRASHNRDPRQRQLIVPNTITRFPLTQTRLISKRLNKGSRIVVYLNVNKNPFSQVNYGSGKDVSDETPKDAKRDLRVRWLNQSFIDIPVLGLPTLTSN